jgi:aminopeptidase N
MKFKVATLALVLFSCLAAPAQRLPNVAVPEHYSLRLVPDFGAAKFSGDESIDIRVLQSTYAITVNALEITFEEVTITSGGTTQRAEVTLQPKQETATLTIPKPLPAGSAQIHIRYTGVLNDKLRGFYLSEADGNKYAVTQFEPTDARRAFPSFDEPAYKAIFDIAVAAPAGDTAISNARIVADEPGPGPLHTIRFAPTPKMSTYLVAVLVGRFECIQGGADDVPIRVCTPPGKQELGRFALNASESFLKYYNRYFAIKYPYGKLDLIAIPDFEAGAMENTGAITFRDIALLLNEKEASVPQLKEVALVIAHEMAHQWFGDLVTMEWWDDIWLNEGFATWMEGKPVAAWRPEWHVEMDGQRSTNEAMGSDSLRNTRPIREAAQTSAQINELFDEIAYNKTAAVLRMLEAYEGPQAFERGVNDYLQAHAYANATAQDFWTAEAAASKQPVDRILSSYVLNAGVPLISTEFHCAGADSSVTISQQRFLFDPSQAESRSKELWQIPVCMSLPGTDQPLSCDLLSQPQQKFRLSRCEPSMFLNSGAHGYYRTAYSREVVSALAPRVEQTLNPVERLSLLDNEWALVRTGLHPIGVFMALGEGLKDDRTPAIMDELGRRFRYITDNLITAHDRESYETWVRGLLRPAMQQLGTTATPADSDERRSLRAAVFRTLGYSGRDAETLGQARSLLQQYMKNPASVDPTLLDPVFTLSAMQGTPAMYEEFVARSKDAKTPEDYYRYLFALAQFTDPALLKRTLDYALSPAVRSQDAPFVIGAVMENSAGRELAWQFVQTHLDPLKQKASFAGTAVMVRFAGDFCTATSKQQVQQFFGDHPVPGAERTLRQTLEDIQNCVDLKAQQGMALASWLNEHPTAAGE